MLCTHLHVDHVGWNTKLAGGKWVPTFANARYVFGKAEYEYWRDHSVEPAHIAVFNDSVKPIWDAGKAELIASDAKLTDEISMISTPGHSPGHMSIHIRSDGEEGLLTGDVAHHPCQMAHLDWSSTADSDPNNRWWRGATCSRALPIGLCLSSAAITMPGISSGTGRRSSLSRWSPSW